jgi:hypothetical protein
MPRFDGTGPCGKGPRSGRGAGNCPGANLVDNSGCNRSGAGRGLGQGRGRYATPSLNVEELQKRIQALEAELALAKKKLEKN